LEIEEKKKRLRKRKGKENKTMLIAQGEVNQAEK
jgi:hypothetical protein